MAYDPSDVYENDCLVALQEAGSKTLTGQSTAVRSGGDTEAGLRVTADHAEEKAIRLLSQNNFDAERLRRNVNSLHLKASYEPLQPLGETDIAGYLEHHHDMIVVTAVRRPIVLSEAFIVIGFYVCVLEDLDRSYIFRQGVERLLLLFSLLLFVLMAFIDFDRCEGGRG